MTTIFYIFVCSYTQTHTRKKTQIKKMKNPFIMYITHIAFPRTTSTQTLLLPVCQCMWIFLLQNIIKFSLCTNKSSPFLFFYPSYTFFLCHPSIHIFAILISSQNNNNNKVGSYLLCFHTNSQMKGYFKGKWREIASNIFFWPKLCWCIKIFIVLTTSYHLNCEHLQNIYCCHIYFKFGI